MRDWKCLSSCTQPNLSPMEYDMRRLPHLIALAGLVGPVLSGATRASNECESNFSTSGDARNGASYLTFVTDPHLDVRSALDQLQQL